MTKITIKCRTFFYRRETLELNAESQLPRKTRESFLAQEQEPAVPAHANKKEEPSAVLETQHPQTPLSTPLLSPSCSTLPLLGIGFADPLCCHGADVVLGVKVSLLYFPPIYNEHDVIDCNAVEKKRKKSNFSSLQV